MIAYLPRSMPVDPGDKVKEMQEYGPNMPAALYMMFSKDDAPTAKLPVNIPKLDEEYNFTNTVLYARGFGLTYETEEPTTQPQTTQPEETTEATGEASTTIAQPATDPTSATQKSEATADSATTENGDGTVQTGEGGALILAVLVILALFAFFAVRYAKSKKQ